MKKLLTATMLLSLAACAGGGDDSTSKTGALESAQCEADQQITVIPPYFPSISGYSYAIPGQPASSGGDTSVTVVGCNITAGGTPLRELTVEQLKATGVTSFNGVALDE